ncbi:hypothetical protein [uncultured Paraglaciecola sp.]|uniref:hypothetical protein n=1 Tax=uncultured Paraglaciecola sp. TaxID=1765024 RepID=UPI002593F55B|nr:hypothetical protein [uncultured Paraglaciecola sp.]
MEYYLKKYGDWAFLVYILVGVAPTFMYDTILNESYVWAFKYLSFPIGALCFYVYLCKVPEYLRKAGRVKGFLWASIITTMLILISGGYVMGLNAMVGEQQQVQLIGEIVELDTYESTKNGMSYYVYIQTTHANEPTKLDVSRKHFESLKVGDCFSEPWSKGSFGLMYKRR